MFDDVGYAARFLAAVPSFLRNPLTPREARAEVGRRLANREGDFLELARRVIYRRPNHPVRRLLALAGCEQGDLEGLVRREGLEGGLWELLERGVYLAIEELKGRRAVVRGSASFMIDPARLLNPLAARHVPSETGGSRGPRVTVPWDIGYLRDEDASLCLLLAAVGGPS